MYVRVCLNASKWFAFLWWSNIPDPSLRLIPIFKFTKAETLHRYKAGSPDHGPCKTKYLIIGPNYTTCKVFLLLNQIMRFRLKLTSEYPLSWFHCNCRLSSYGFLNNSQMPMETTDLDAGGAVAMIRFLVWTLKALSQVQSPALWVAPLWIINLQCQCASSPSNFILITVTRWYSECNLLIIPGAFWFQALPAFWIF